MGTPLNRRRTSTAARLAAAASVALALAFAAVADIARAAYPLAEVGRIVFASDRGGSGLDIFVMSATGANPTNLTPGSAGADDSPVFSPDGQWIAFERGGFPNRDIFLMRSDGSGAVNLTAANTTDDLAPAFSPDGRSIAFQRDVDPGGGLNYEIMLMGTAGQGLLNLTQSPADDESAPDFFPDGTRIAYANAGAGGQDIYAIGVSGGPPSNLTPGSASALTDPAVSPNGGFIELSDFSDLFLMGAQGESQFGLVNTTNSPTVAEFAPAIAPDRLGTAYTGIGGGNSEVYFVDSSGRSQVNLTNSAGVDRQPAWEYIQSCTGLRATIVGSDLGEVIEGTAGPDVIRANGGNDVVKGRGGRDRICGGFGRDRLIGGKGGDLLLGEDGKDKLRGGKGKDKLKGGKGRDVLIGGPGRDRLKGGPGKDKQRQ